MRDYTFMEVDVDTFLDWYSNKLNITNDFAYQDLAFGQRVWVFTRNGQTTPEHYIRNYWTAFMIPYRNEE